MKKDIVKCQRRMWLTLGQVGMRPEAERVSPIEAGAARNCPSPVRLVSFRIAVTAGVSVRHGSRLPQESYSAYTPSRKYSVLLKHSSCLRGFPAR